MEVEPAEVPDKAMDTSEVILNEIEPISKSFEKANEEVASESNAKDPLSTEEVVVEEENIDNSENPKASTSGETEQIEVEEFLEQLEDGVEVIEDSAAIIEMPGEDNTNDSVTEEEFDDVDQSTTVIEDGHEQIIIQETNDVTESQEEVYEIHTYEEESIESVESAEGDKGESQPYTIRTDDGGEIEITLSKAADSSEDTKKSKTGTEDSAELVTENRTPKQRKTRKAAYDIPMHVLGVDINKPVESVINGRPVPKPRLGVKVPYRNLTSQMVSKAEIEEEVMERARQKQMKDKESATFARRLTQRLAKKIAPNSEEDVDDPSSSDVKEVEENAKKSDKIHNDSDLLAILEGEGDDMPPVLPKEVSTPQEDDSNLKALEREIALQQLQELPHQEPKPRIFKSRQIKAPVLTPEVPIKPKEVVPPKIKPVEKTPTNLGNKNKENSSQSSSKSSKKDVYSIDLATPKKFPVEVEPQVKVNMVLKTYSRKRKISEPKESYEDFINEQKKATAEDADMKKTTSSETKSSSNDVYVTKSSRIIKKKIIWDPAEAQPRSPRPTSKQTESTSKVAKNVDKNANNEVSTPKKEKSPEKVTPKKVVLQQEKKIKPVIQKIIRPKRNRTEIDKLLMDEGAVKMLYELNNDQALTKPKKNFVDVEKANKDLIKKANLLKNELEQTTSTDKQKSLRKKESFSPVSVTKSASITERKLSKDSAKSSIHTPPGSPFAHSQSSMLIRRRSSSSISSSDDADVEEGALKGSRRKSDANKKRKKSVDDNKEDKEDNNKPVKYTKPEAKMEQYKSFTVKKTGKHIAIDLHYIDEKCYFTVQVLDELLEALNKFSKDKDCAVLTLSSSSEAFCLGLDYSYLVTEKESERTQLAKEYSQRVIDILLCLLQFPKVLIACIQGKCVGLGVTMLPLFDIVLASDTATFETPYAKLGCPSEAGFLLSFPYLSNHGLAAEMLYAGQQLTADDASRRGLAKLCWPEKFKNEIKNLVTAISKGSKQSLEVIKKQLRGTAFKEAEAAINKESTLLIEHWTSKECQSAFSAL